MFEWHVIVTAPDGTEHRADLFARDAMSAVEVAESAFGFGYEARVVSMKSVIEV